MSDMQLYKIKSLLLKMSLFWLTAPISFLISFLYFTIAYKENIFKKGVFNKKWDKIPESDEIFLYIAPASFPQLFALPHIFTHDKPSFLWCTRSKAINEEYLPSHVNYLSDKHISLISAQYVILRFIKRLKKHLIKAPSTVVHVITSSTFHVFCLALFAKHKIPESNYTVTIIDEGVTTGVNYVKFSQDKELWDSEFKKYKRQFTSAAKSYLPFVPAISSIDVKFPFFCSMMLSNVKFWEPYSDFLIPPAEELGRDVSKIHVENILPQDMIGAFSSSQRKSYLGFVGIDKDYYDKIFTESSKPNLIITDTIFMINEGRFHLAGEKIVEKYGGDFNLFYKPHPEMFLTRDFVDTDKFLAKHNIPILPADVTVEVLFFTYPQLCFGGYASGAYIHIRGERVKFFIARNGLADPASAQDKYNGTYILNTYRYLRDLYNKGVYPDAEIIWV